MGNLKEGYAMEKFILIVDDSTTLRASVQFALAGAGYKVAEARDGKDGLVVLQNIRSHGDQVSMIISDINMPNMDGITFIREVKKTPFKFIPILVLTTESQESKKLEGKNAGATGWLVKPFKSAQLLQVVKKLVG
jgi:two-component system chemotaxis response regulator CheY